MKPIKVSVRVNRPRAEVFAVLDVLANHEPFTNHMLIDWSCTGPAAGVGAKARMRAKAPGRPQWVDMEVVASDPPRLIVEEAVGAGGRRRTRGTYTLEELPDGATDVAFELVVLAAPAAERLLGPVLGLWLRRVNAKAMAHLAACLSVAQSAPEPAAFGG